MYLPYDMFFYLNSVSFTHLFVINVVRCVHVYVCLTVIISWSCKAEDIGVFLFIFIFYVPSLLCLCFFPVSFCFVDACCVPVSDFLLPFYPYISRMCRYPSCPNT